MKDDTIYMLVITWLFVVMFMTIILTREVIIAFA